MKILHIDTGAAMRGGQYQTLMLLDGLDALGVGKTLLAGPGLRSCRCVEAASWRTVRRLAPAADLIHAHDARAHTLAVVHGADKPVVVARRVAFPIKQGILSRWKYRRAAHFIAVSQHVADVLVGDGVPREKTTVVYDAASGAPASPFRAGRFQVVSLGLDDPLKGGELVRAACRASGIEPTFSTDLPRDLAQADAMLYLSESEGLGSAILLAMASGVPVIASRVGGIPEAVAHEETGLLVENDVAAVSAALLRLRADPALRERLAAAARERVFDRFSDTRMVRETARVYRRVLGLPDST